MNKEMFWGLIQRTITLLPGNTGPIGDQRGKLLVEILQELDVNDLFAFDRIWDAYRHKLGQDRILDKASDIAGGLSDDGCTDFTAWAILQGREAVEKILEDPKSLYRLVPEGECPDITSEIGGYTTMTALEKKTGKSYNHPNNPYKGSSFDIKEDKFLTYEEKAIAKHGKYYKTIQQLLAVAGHWPEETRRKKFREIVEGFAKELNENRMGD